MQATQKSFSLVKESLDVEPFVPSVCSIADKHRSELGFLPTSAFVQLSKRGRLWILLEKGSEKLAGYLLYGGRYPNLKVTQLFVCNDYRKLGAATLLIDALKAHAKEHKYSTVSARVAKDLPSNDFWAKNELEVIRTVPGGRTTGRAINIRLWEVPQASIFWQAQRSFDDFVYATSPALDNSLYVMDLNVFFDVLKDRIDRDAAQWVMSAAMAGRIHLAVTPEFHAELERHNPTSRPDHLLKFAKALPVLPNVTQDRTHRLVKTIRPLVFAGMKKTGRRAPNDDSDLAHLAYAICHGAKGFLTREQRLLRASETLQEHFGLEVLTPADLVDPDPPIAPGTRVETEDAEIAVSELKADAERTVHAFVRRLVPAADLNRLLKVGSSHSPKQRLVAQAGDRLIGVLIVERGPVGSRLVLGHLIVDEETPSATFAYDQLLEHLQCQLVSNQVQNIHLTIPLDTSDLEETLKRRGYRRTESSVKGTTRTLSKIAYVGMVSVEQWPDFAKHFYTASRVLLSQITAREDPGQIRFKLDLGDGNTQVLSLFEFETLISPGIIEVPMRSGAIVPLRRTYAEALIPGSTSQFVLFPAKEASFRLERAYFLSRDRTSLFPRSTLVIFYESSSSGGVGAAIGCGRVTYSGYLTVQEAIQKLSRQGVLSKSAFTDMARESGRITAFTFDSVQRFVKNVPISILKREEYVSDANLVTAEQLSPDQLSGILRLGFDMEK